MDVGDDAEAGLGAVAAYLLCRDLGAGFISSLLGGCIFGLTGLVGHTDWPQILMTCIWIPIVVLFFLRVVRERRPSASAASEAGAERFGPNSLDIWFRRLGCMHYFSFAFKIHCRCPVKRAHVE